jgi:hypothetical protein
MNPARRRSGRSPAAWIAAVVLVLSFPVIYNVWVILVMAASAVLGWWACSRRQPVISQPGPAVTPAPGRAQADAASLRAQLGQARADARQLLTDCNADLARLRAELDQAGAEIRDLRGQLADATESAHAAWDAASDRTPRRTTKDADEAANERLAATPMSGVRRLGGQQNGT